jgi:hypothetical protein
MVAARCVLLPDFVEQLRQAAHAAWNCGMGLYFGLLSTNLGLTMPHNKILTWVLQLSVSAGNNIRLPIASAAR